MEKNVTVTVKTKLGSLVTIRGDEPQEFVDRVQAAAIAGFDTAVGAFEEIVTGASSAHALQTVVNAVGGTVISTTPTAPAPEPWAQEQGQFAPVAPPVAAYTPPPAGGSQKQCAHGLMTKREGQGPYGPYKAFMCPTPKGTPDQCKAIYLKSSDPDWQTF